MEYSGWVAMNPDLAEAWRMERPEELASPSNQATMFRFLQLAIFREFEDSHYQYERGLFTADEFEARRVLWRVNLSAPGAQRIWASQREPSPPASEPRSMPSWRRWVAECWR